MEYRLTAKEIGSKFTQIKKNTTIMNNEDENLQLANEISQKLIYLVLKKEIDFEYANKRRKKDKKIQEFFRFLSKYDNRLKYYTGQTSKNRLESYNLCDSILLLFRINFRLENKYYKKIERKVKLEKAINQ